ncbi:mechanosensitive ion channel family protein [Nocardioides speluncae]|uniref:mechanosensitive ion channel family protein n=1 Tax=Nocardioides speluncae TaxID=2670337 RepID=UPI001F0BF6C7|nr:mechanosensitive ion channel family protein [Nocardioides speluncae]
MPVSPAPYLLPLADPCDADQTTCRLMWDLTSNETAARAADVVIGRPLAVVGLVVLGLVARWVLHRLIDRLVRRAEDGVLPGRISTITLGGSSVGAALGVTEDPATNRRVQRARTMGSLLKSIVTGVIFTIVVIMSISEIGYDIGPLIAGAGILGVALGFGAQSLVKDFLSGIFMIFEDQYGVGDVIDAGEASGTVEAVGLRVTRLRDVNGTVWYVRNGEVLRIGNMSQNWARTVLDIAVSYNQDLAKIRRVLKEVAHDLWEDDEFKGRVIEEPEVWGVEALGPDTVTVRVTLKTAPMEQWAIARELRERIKARFDYEGIEIPVPQRMVWQQPEGPAAEPPATGGA